MRKTISLFAGALALAAVALAALTPAQPAAAQTTNFSTSIPGVEVLPFHFSGQYTANTTSVTKFKLPFKATLLSVQATARANGANTPTLTVDLLSGGSSVLSAPISITSGTVSFGTLATTAISDEATLSVDFAIGGGSGSPTWNDITLIVTLVRT